MSQHHDSSSAPMASSTSRWIVFSICAFVVAAFNILGAHFREKNNDYANLRQQEAIRDKEEAIAEKHRKKIDVEVANHLRRINVVRSETASESAESPESLDEARTDFVKMIRDLSLVLRYCGSEFGATLEAAGKQQLELAALRLEETASVLASVPLDPRNKEKTKADLIEAIEHADKSLVAIYGQLDHNTLDNTVTTGIWSSCKSGTPRFASGLERQIKLFEEAIVYLEGELPEAIDCGLTIEDEAKQIRIVRSAEIVCQRSRFAYFSLVVEWDLWLASDPQKINSLANTYSNLEKRAVTKCRQLRDCLAKVSQDRSRHVGKFTHSMERRLTVVGECLSGDSQGVSSALLDIPPSM